MIQLTKLNRASIFVNSDLIRSLESTPDTVITFMDGQCLVVLEAPDEIQKKIILFRNECFTKYNDKKNIEQR